MLDNGWTMTCGYGLQRTGRTLSIDLRIRCFVPTRKPSLSTRLLALSDNAAPALTAAFTG